MYYAIDENGVRISIDEVISGKRYLCPVCDEPLILKRGTLVAHHFAHRSGMNCDPWYSKKMKSFWHRMMQNKFPSDMRERVVHSSDGKEYRVADVLVPIKGRTLVFEFQHSVIPVEEFVARTRFYLNLGYSIRWIFDFRTGESPKCLYYAETDDSTTREKRVVWPGADRVRIFDADAVRLLFDETRCNFEKKLQIFLYVNTGPGKYVRKSNGIFSWGKWEYEDPIGKKDNFYIQPYFDMSENLADFWGAFYTEEEFEKQILQLCDKTKK